MLLSMITQTKDREIINRVLKQSALTPRHLVDMWFWPTKYRFLSPLNNENINHTTLYTIDKLHLKTIKYNISNILLKCFELFA